MDDGILILVRLLQVIKTLSLILVTLSGIVILVKLVQSLNPSESILVRLEPKDIFDNSVQL